MCFVPDRKDWIRGPAAKRISGYLRSFVQRERCSVEELARRSRAGVNSKTLHAILNSEGSRPWPADGAERLIAYVARRSYLPPKYAWAYLVNEVQSGIRWLQQMPAMSYWHFSHRKAGELELFLRRHERSASVTTSFGRLPLGGLMPKRMVHRVLDSLHGSRMSRRHLDGMRRWERLRSEALFDINPRQVAAGISRPHRREFYMPEAELIRMLTRHWPFDLCSGGDIDECIDTLMHDVIGNKMAFSLLTPMEERPDPVYSWLLHFSTVTAIDRQVLLRREAHRCYVTTTEHIGDIHADMVLDYRFDMLESLPSREGCSAECSLRRIQHLVDRHLR